MVIAKVIGKKIFALRKQKGLTQEQVADSIHISQPVYARIEKGIGTSWANYIDSLCDFFAITLEDLVKTTSDIIQENTEQKGGITVNQSLGTIQILEKLIEQYEERIKGLKKNVEELKQTIESLLKP